VEAKLARLRAVRHAPDSAPVIAEMRKALADASNLVVAEAAAIIAEANLADLAADLAAAFDRLLIRPEDSDKACRGKIALVEALNQLEYPKPEVFLRGIRHVQGPFWEKEQDAAAPLRAHCALGLVRIDHPEAVCLLVDLLLDRARAARAGAVRALGGSGKLSVIPLLRFKALIGDKDVEVISECFTSLLQLDPAASVPFVTRFLEGGKGSVREAAALALGESRRPEALEPLKACWEKQRRQPLEEVVLLAIALLRLPAATEFLLAIVAREKPPSAPAALSALVIHRHNPHTRGRISEAVAGNGDPGLKALFEKKFAAKDS
jgi:HEAT repeat protein